MVSFNLIHSHSIFADFYAIFFFHASSNFDFILIL